MPETARSIWLRKERSGRGPTPEHGRAEIAAAAIALADADGLSAVSTRRVAAAIGAGATSLYRYVRNRDELLELMYDAACGELDLSGTMTGDWRVDLRAVAEDLLALYRRHPWVLDLAQGQIPLTPNSVAFLDHTLSTLAHVDVTGDVKLEAVALVNGLVVNFARLELAAGRTAQAWQEAQAEYLTAVVSQGRYPHLAAAVASSTPMGAERPDLLDRVLVHVVSGVLGSG